MKRKKPKMEWKVFRNAVRNGISELLGNNKNRFFSLDQISEYLLKHGKTRTCWFDLRFRYRLARGHGLKGIIGNAIRHLKKNEHRLIVSSAKKGKGYSELDPDREDSPARWDSNFFANERQRESIPPAEKSLLVKLFRKCVRKCTNPKLKRKYRKIAKKYGVRV